jgi:hypothetical protein
MKKYLLSLFAKPRYEEIIRAGCMYRLKYKGHRLVKQERIDKFGGFTTLTSQPNSRACTDRSRTDLDHPNPPRNEINLTKAPENI